MHIVIRRYKIQPDSGKLLMESIHNGFGPIVKTAQGFVSYNAFVNENEELCSVGIFKDKTSAENSNTLAREFITSNNLASYFQGPPEITEGEVSATA